MRARNLFLCLVATSLFCSCSGNLAQRQNTAVSRGVYATQDAMKAGRFDLAQRYNDEVTRLIPPPTEKERIKVNQFSVKSKPVKKISGTNFVLSDTSKNEPPPSTQPYVVLPPGFSADNVVVVDSEQYKKILSDNSELKGQVEEEKRTFTNYKRETDNIIREKEIELQKLRATPGFFGRIWNFISGFFKWGTLGIVLLGLGLLVAAIFIPGLLPIVITIFRGIGAFIGGILRIINRLLLWLIDRFSKK